MSAAARLAALACCLAAAAPAAEGQVSGALDLGAGTYRPDRAIPGGIASIAPSLRIRRGLFEVAAVGNYSDAPAGRWNFQGGGTGTLRTPRLGPLQGEVFGQVDWTSHYRVEGTTTISGGARASVSPSERIRLWLGRSQGSAATLGGRRPLQRSEVGTSAWVGGVHLNLSLLRTSFDLMSGPNLGVTPDSGSPSRPQIVNGDSGRVERRLALTDAVVSGQWRFASVMFDAMVGRRFSNATPELTIWGVSAVRSLTPTVALVAAAGRAASDPVTSVPGSRYYVLGLRLILDGSASAVPLLAAPPPASAGEDTPFRVGPPVPAGREVMVRAPGARTVELAGDFTDWRPIPLLPWGDGSWRVTLRIAPGVHRLAVRTDQGEWHAPPGTRPIASEFGGEVAEIVVE